MRHNFRAFAVALVAAGSTCLVNLGAAQAACTQITNAAQLQAMQSNLAGTYCLANDINAVGNFTPIGNDATPFTGTFHGQGHTIHNLRINSSATRVGLFGATKNAVIRDVSLVNARIVGNALAGAVVGLLDVGGGDTSIVRVHVSGTVRCTGDNCWAGGIVGATSLGGSGEVRDSSSAASVSATGIAGGVVGRLYRATITRSSATGAVTCTASACVAGGLVGRASSAYVEKSYATGAVTCTAGPCMSGGLAGRVSIASIQWSFATGPVTAADGADSRAGGLIALIESDASPYSYARVYGAFALGPVTGGATPPGYTAALIGEDKAGYNTNKLSQIYAAGTVTSSGAITGGLTAAGSGMYESRSTFWDTQTTGQMTSASGAGRTTDQLREKLDDEFYLWWWITETLSYPYLDFPEIDFNAPLATLVRFSKVFTFLPIGQLDASQYLSPPDNADKASLAAVYTMIARAAGITWNDPDLINAKIDKYFWDDATRTTTWQGPITLYAQRGPSQTIAAGTPLDATNVIGSINAQQLVILRGRYTRSGGGTAVHWMLGTLRNESNFVLANDPLTGKQVSINPETKRVQAPADFPLTDFTVDLYRPVELIQPPPLKAAAPGHGKRGFM